LGYDFRMSRLIAITEATSNTENARIGFQTEGNKNWPAWDRFITLDGKKGHYIGNVCGTCPFTFERHAGANEKISPADLSEVMRNGISKIDELVVRAAMASLPAGPYKAMLLSFVPQIIVPSQKGDYFFEEQTELWGIDPFWGVPHYAKNEYYRTRPIKISKRGQVFEFIVPMFPRRYLFDEAIRKYETCFSRESIPTALALSVLDIKEPADWEGEPDVTEHWCLAHYLLDGHHKMFAASQAGKPISLLSFLAVEKGVSSSSEIADLLTALAQG
jgi:hypothetical protein